MTISRAARYMRRAEALLRLSVAGFFVGLTGLSLIVLPGQTSSAQEVCSANCASPSVSMTPSPVSLALTSTATTLQDTAMLSGGSGPTGTMTFTLVYKGSTVDTESTTASGNGSYSTPTGYTLPDTGTVTGTYQWDVSYSGDTNNSAATDNNDPAGQVAVSAASPTIASLPSPASLGLTSTATTVQDTGTLSGGYYPTGTITFTLYQGSILLDTETAAVNGNGTYSTPTGYSLPATSAGTGTYQWDDTYSGNGNNSAASDTNDPAEDVSPVCTTSSGGVTTCTFGYTGGPAGWTVPAGVSEVTVGAYGAQGGGAANGTGGLGGEATADVPVAPGEGLQVDVGGAGSGGAGGWNGGGGGIGGAGSGGGGRTSEPAPAPPP